MPSILPKGIVVNTAGISGDIQRIDREPLALEEIAKFWKVYTTTKRRLVDPTAERLENFWWRIWGSRKRNLRGAIVAKIFADISDEISFVPLQGPLNRDESGGRPTTSITRGLGTASTTAIHGIRENDSFNGGHSSSLSKYAATMLPPILKKTRGPSSTGPRPTARFISPHTSGEEDNAETSITTSLGAHVVVRPPTPPALELQLFKYENKAEKSTGSRRKAHGFVAATAGHKRRPGVPRRPSSDPAAGRLESTSNSSSKDICASLSEKTHQQQGSDVSHNQVDFQEQVSPSPESQLSKKAARRTRSEKNGNSRASPGQSSALRRDIDHESATSSRQAGWQDEAETLDQLQFTGLGQGYLSKERGMDRISQVEASQKTMQSGYTEPRTALSSQNLAAGDPRFTLRGDKVVQRRPTERCLPKDVDGESSISAAPTYSIATRKTDQQDKSNLESVDHQGTSISGKDQERSSMRLEQASLFAKRPVQAAKSASALFTSPTYQSTNSMSRSKSQLTLLLEKDRAKEKENKERPDSSSKPKDTKPR